MTVEVTSGLRNLSTKITLKLHGWKMNFFMQITPLLRFEHQTTHVAIRSVAMLPDVLAECVAILVRGPKPADDTRHWHRNRFCYFLFRRSVLFWSIYRKNIDVYNDESQPIYNTIPICVMRTVLRRHSTNRYQKIYPGIHKIC